MADDREQRNAIFGNNGPVAPNAGGIQTVSAAASVQAEFGLDIPVEVVPIPSGGKTYPQDHPLHGRETLEIRAMTAREEDILTSKALLKKGTVITELIKSCLVDKSFNPNDMLTGDRNALMVAVRITGYGAGYDAEVECPACEVKASQTFNLAELPLIPLGIEPVAPGMNVFEFVLPRTKKVVRFKFMTGHDEVDIMASAEKQKRLNLGNSIDSVVTTNLLYSIVNISGVEDRGKIGSFVRMMPAQDSLALRNYIRDNEPGIKMKQDVVCKSCGHEWEVSIPLGASFLWPQAGR